MVQLKLVVVNAANLSKPVKKHKHRVFFTISRSGVVGLWEMEPEGYSLIDIAFVVVRIPEHLGGANPFADLPEGRLGGRGHAVVFNNRVRRIQYTLRRGVCQEKSGQ
jgi:hypothetical protein